MKWSNLTIISKAIIAILTAAVIGFLVYHFSPGLKVDESKSMDKIDLSDKDVNNIETSDELGLSSDEISTDVSSKPLIRIGGYAWNAQSGIIAANGGPKTTKNSLMERNGVNLELVRQDWLSELRNLHLKFVEDFDQGKSFPTQGVSAIMIMGDGVPFYISSVQQALDDKYGAGK